MPPIRVVLGAYVGADRTMIYRRFAKSPNRIRESSHVLHGSGNLFEDGRERTGSRRSAAVIRRKHRGWSFARLSAPGRAADGIDCLTRVHRSINGESLAVQALHTLRDTV